MLPVASEYMSKFLLSSDWRCRHGALMALSHICEITPDDDRQRLIIVQQVLSYCRDTHSRVRYAAVNALGQVSTLIII